MIKITEKYVDTPRFLKVKLQMVYDTIVELIEAGYSEPTHYNGSDYYAVQGKSIGTNLMHFAACKNKGGINNV